MNASITGRYRAAAPPACTAMTALMMGGMDHGGPGGHGSGGR